MPRTPLSAVEAAFVRLAQDHYGLTEAKQRVAHALAPVFAAHGVAPGTAGVAIDQEGDTLVLVTPEPERDKRYSCSDPKFAAAFPHNPCMRTGCAKRGRCMFGFECD